MIDSKYGLKYSFPHTLVHIVDNSMYTGELPVTTTYDPSLFATIVVTGMPMGVDNRMVTVTRSDVLNKAFGADTLTSSDIEKYGQAVEYPSSLIRQNAPVKLLRVTPTDAKYGVAIVYLEWKYSDDGSAIETRLLQAAETDLTTTAIDLSAFANPERLAKATFSRLAKEPEKNDGWTRDVLMTYVSAGRGSAYNNYAVYINAPTWDQRKKYKNVIYNFGTIDTRRNTTLSSNYKNELEAFTAAFINDETKAVAYGVANTLDTVNTQMKKRLEGSSIMIPYVNEKAIRTLYSRWKEFFADKLETENIDETVKRVNNYLYQVIDTNLFDVVFGKCIYNDNLLNIPYLKVDAPDSEIPFADDDKVIVVYDQPAVTPCVQYDNTTAPANWGTATYWKWNKDIPTDDNYVLTTEEPVDWSTNYTEYYTKTDGEYTKVDDESAPTWVSNKYYEYSPFLTRLTTEQLSNPSNFTKYTASESFPEVTSSDKLGELNVFTNTSDSDMFVEDYTPESLKNNTQKCVDAVYDHNLKNWIQELYNVKDSDKPDDTTTLIRGYQSSSVAPGTLYLYSADTQPVFQLVTSINSYTGSTSTVTIPKVLKLTADKTLVTKITSSKDYLNAGSEYSAMIKKYVYVAKPDPDNAALIKGFNNKLKSTKQTVSVGDIIAVGFNQTYFDTSTKLQSQIISFKLFQVTAVDENNRIVEGTGYWEYPSNYYAALDYLSHYSETGIYDTIALYSNNADVTQSYTDGSLISDEYTELEKNYLKKVFPTVPKFNTITFDISSENAYTAGAYEKIGALIINDLSTNATFNKRQTIGSVADWSISRVNMFDAYLEDETNWDNVYSTTQIIVNTTTAVDYQTGKATVTLNTIDVFTENNFRVGTPPSSISIPDDVIGNYYDLAHVGSSAYIPYKNDVTLKNPDRTYLAKYAAEDEIIYRYQVTGTALSAFKLSFMNINVPDNYYLDDYGISPTSENGGIPITGGYSGFFDEYEAGNISSIEFKLKYSELLVKAFRGEIDSRILSPVRVPAKFMFDAGYNCVLGIKSLPYSEPTVEDIILASTIFTQDEKEEYIYDKTLTNSRIQYDSVDVKQAMYDLMIERCYQRMPEDKRPIGPGSGFQLYLDTGFSDNIDTIKRIIASFKTKFTNPNASLDIGGYTSALNGVTYTYTKRIVDNLFRHCQQYTINKPFANTYATIPAEEVVEFYPNIDTTDWDLEELMYTSGGNSWVLDVEGNLRRKSQKTLYNEETGTSDLLQESNMRTLSQLIFLLQNQLDNWLLEYVDDGILTSMTESINNIFSGWVGTRVDALDIQFEKDLNTDGGEIVVCYVNVVFRGLLLRVPIIVNVNRRES